MYINVIFKVSGSIFKLCGSQNGRPFILNLVAFYHKDLRYLGWWFGGDGAVTALARGCCWLKPRRLHTWQEETGTWTRYIR